MSIHTAIAAFDIETVPDTEVGRRVFGFEGSFVEVAEQMLAQRLEQTDGRTDFLKPPYHRIVTISIAWLDIQLGQVRFKLDSIGEDRLDEGALLEAFFTVLRRGGYPTLVSWNGHSFDLPVIRYRAMLHGIDASPYYAAGDKWDNYQHRYGSLHTDLMDVLASYGGDRVGLDEMCQIIGLPGKTVTEGHRVFQHIARNEWDIVETYCELDALNTLLLYVAWQHSTGRFDPFTFERIQTTLTEMLLADPRDDVQAYGQALRDWRPGRSRRHLAEELDS
ncbi:MAG: 3'-5' exonuclease [Candidatus Dadabacteria bacterium]|nr:MAG: 3'-5' exonuclease [Candidatus Dadabacteria bacterium]